jgi:hypothetical protein
MTFIGERTASQRVSDSKYSWFKIFLPPWYRLVAASLAADLHFRIATCQLSEITASARAVAKFVCQGVVMIGVHLSIMEESGF